MDERLAQRLLINLEIAHDEFQRREALAWLILSYDGDYDVREEAGAIVGAYGPFDSPEEALIQKTRHDASSLEGFVNVIVPLYPPVEWRGQL
jgi:hypothetical protein